MVKPHATDTLWHAFATSRDPALWEQLVPEFDRLAKSIAVLFARSDSEREILFGAALAALVKALDQYAVSGTGSFAEFATPLVLEEIQRSRHPAQRPRFARQPLSSARGKAPIH